jgi:serine/threonine protein phosphatase 1
MRTIVIGDIHGCYAELQKLLAAVHLTADDRLISLGDIVDRGPDSVKVYDFLRQRPNTIVLMGNHERKHLNQTLSYSQEIVKVQFADRYPEFLNWIEDLPYFYETEEAILVHAAFENGIAIGNQRPEVLCGCTAGEKYLSKQYAETYWIEHYRGTKPIVFGHHVVGNAPKIKEHKIYGIDTGACHGGRLTALVLPSFECVQIPAPIDYWHEEQRKWQLPVLQAKPWNSYKWEKIQAICHDFKQTQNAEVTTFLRQKEQWIKQLLAQAPIVITQLESKLAELIEEYGADGFKKPASQLSYAVLLYKANSSSLTLEFLKQVLSTPEKWQQVTQDLGITAQKSI